MISESKRADILTRIRDAEKEYDVRVLYAVESGSRAWGFASPNSDYDVRFIYVHPKEWYLTVNLEDRRDVIEYDIIDEIDINGWDVRKTLKLFWKSNPALIEWLQSPIVYVDDHTFATEVRQFVSEIYSLEKGIYHYRSMAKTNYREYLREAIVPIKKYFYVLRPLLSTMWLEKYRKPAPIEFHKLRLLVADREPLNSEISALLERKQACAEKETITPIPILNDFIEAQLSRLETLELKTTKCSHSIEPLNKLFIKILG